MLPLTIIHMLSEVHSFTKAEGFFDLSTYIQFRRKFSQQVDNLPDSIVHLVFGKYFSQQVSLVFLLFQKYLSLIVLYFILHFKFYGFLFFLFFYNRWTISLARSSISKLDTDSTTVPIISLRLSLTFHLDLASINKSTISHHLSPSSHSYLINSGSPSANSQTINSWRLSFP